MSYRLQTTGYRKQDFIRSVNSATVHRCTHRKWTVATSATGFTLIEIMVAVAVFAIVMLIAAGSLLVVLDANRKAQALQAAMTNLNFAVESMVRNARVGTTYYCSNDIGDSGAAVASPDDCGGGELFAFEAWDGDPSFSGDQIVYRYNSAETEKSLERSINGGIDYIRVTAPDVSIEELQFEVRGTDLSDEEQPLMIVRMRGTAGAGRTATEFNLQSGASQRVLDLP